MNQLVFRGIGLLLVGLFVRDCESFSKSRAWPWSSKIQRTANEDSRAWPWSSKIQRTTNENDIWRFMGITREEFKQEHQVDLSPAVMNAIIQEMKNIISGIHSYLVSKERLFKEDMTKRDGADIGGVAEKDLQLLVDSLNISKGIHNADNYKQPAYLETCMDEISPQFPVSDKKYKFVGCALLLFKTTKDYMDAVVFDDSLDSFMDIFEEYTKTLTSFVQLLKRYEKETGTKYMKRNVATEFLESLTKGLDEDLSL